MRPRVPLAASAIKYQSKNPPFHNRILIWEFENWIFALRCAVWEKKSIYKWRKENGSRTKMNRSIHFYCRMWVEVKTSDSCHRQMQCTLRLQPHPGEIAGGAAKKNLLRICMIAMREMCSELKSYSIYIVCRRSFAVIASLCNYTNCICKPINT